MSIGDFFNDLGDFGKDIFQTGKSFVTGDWSDLGGNVSQLGADIKADPWVLAAPAALAGGAALGAGALGAFGAAEGAGALGAGAAEVGAGAGAELGGSALGFAGPVEASSTAFNPIAADFEALGYGAASPVEMVGGGSSGGGVLGLGDLGGGTGGITNVADAGAGGGGGIFDTVSNFAGKAGNYAMNNPFQTLGVGAAAAGLGSALMKGQGTSANEQNVANMTSAAVQQAQYDTVAGRELQNYFRTGTLPRGMQEQVDKARKAARAAAISAAAKSGQNTNPQNNTQLQQAFEEADRQALIMATQMEVELNKQGTAMVELGMRATQLSMEGYKFLTDVDRYKGKQVTDAMIALAGAFGGGKMNINLGGGSRAA